MATIGELVEAKMKDDDEQRKALDKIKRIVNTDKFMINRVPKETKQEFIEFARECYFDDYGLAFKAIWEFYKADARHIDLLQRVMALESVVSNMKSNPVQSQKNTLKLLNGKQLEVKCDGR